MLKAADESTKRYAEGRFLSVLDGVPEAVKDKMDLAGCKKCSSVSRSTSLAKTMPLAIVFRSG